MQSNHERKRRSAGARSSAGLERGIGTHTSTGGGPEERDVSKKHGKGQSVSGDQKKRGVKNKTTSFWNPKHGKKQPFPPEGKKERGIFLKEKKKHPKGGKGT